MLEYVIVGGGIHGVHLAVMLQAQAGVLRDRVRILDPYPALLQRWSTATRNTGMTYLRSPVVHHLDAEPMSLLRFSRTQGKPDAFFVHPYQRPGYALFQAHSRAVVQRWGLNALHERAAATGLRRISAGWEVQTTAGSVRARRVVLAPGPSAHLSWPSWAHPLLDSGRVQHIFEDTFDRAGLPSGHVVVVGGGISAAQLSLHLAAERPGKVTMLVRHPFRVHLFDSDPVWLGPLGRLRFAQVAEPKRRDYLKAVRHRGSLPPELEKRLRAARAAGRLRVVEANVLRAQSEPSGIGLYTCCDDVATAQHVVLATGFDGSRPGGEWLSRTVEREGLPLAHCGFPKVSATLEWAPGLYVSGALAELEVGPPSRNISGARIAARIISNAALNYA